MLYQLLIWFLSIVQEPTLYDWYTGHGVHASRKATNRLRGRVHFVQSISLLNRGLSKYYIFYAATLLLQSYYAAY